MHLWRSDAYIGMLSDFKDEVTCMTKCFDGVAFCTWRGLVHLWDKHLNHCTKTIELASLSFKILSLNIACVDYNKRHLLVTSIEGDVISIELSDSKSNTVRARRLNGITKLNGQMKALSIIN